MKQFEICVKILVNVDDIEDVMEIAKQYAEMAIKYKSISAEKILDVSAKELD